MIIACPCALGFATPTALLVASGRGAQLGIFLKGRQALEAAKAIDTVDWDKTETITTGHVTVVDAVITARTELDTLLRDAGAVENASEHVIATAITTLARAVCGRFRRSRSSLACPAWAPKASSMARKSWSDQRGCWLPAASRCPPHSHSSARSGSNAAAPPWWSPPTTPWKACSPWPTPYDPPQPRRSANLTAWGYARACSPVTTRLPPRRSPRRSASKRSLRRY